MSASHPNKLAFEEGVRLVCYSWTALKLAVEQCWGGVDSAEKRNWLIGVIVEHFDKNGKKLDIDDLEDILSDVMDAEFYTILEDDSAHFVAKHLVELFYQCTKGDFTEVERLRGRESALNKVTSTSVMQGDDDTDSEDGSGEDDTDQMEVEEKPSRRNHAPIIDEDGFETVVRRR